VVGLTAWLFIAFPKQHPNWLSLPQPSYGGRKIAVIFISSSHINQNNLLAMHALNKTTAAKLIVLWNLPVLLLLAGAFEVGSKVLVY